MVTLVENVGSVKGATLAFIMADFTQPSALVPVTDADCTLPLDPNTMFTRATSSVSARQARAAPRTALSAPATAPGEGCDSLASGDGPLGPSPSALAPPPPPMRFLISSESSPAGPSTTADVAAGGVSGFLSPPAPAVLSLSFGSLPSGPCLPGSAEWALPRALMSRSPVGWGAEAVGATDADGAAVTTAALVVPRGVADGPACGRLTIA